MESILDSAFHGHLAFVEDGQPIAIPMLYVRDGERLYLHGAPASRALKVVGSSAPLCFTVTQLDGLVLARSWFKHSVNFRSAVVFGVGRAVTGREEKLEAMRQLVDHIVPGRADDSRWPTDKELRATSIVAMSIDDASVKTRIGDPVDDENDYDLPYWAGQVPLSRVVGAPAPVEGCEEAVPAYLSEFVSGSPAARR